ncbi:hypothetical protein ECG_00729 [Echinococcus granulosus]|nr:hypothetical protein ECG_00729 [Echinococcus granulosus]
MNLIFHNDHLKNSGCRQWATYQEQLKEDGRLDNPAGQMGCSQIATFTLAMGSESSITPVANPHAPFLQLQICVPFFTSPSPRHPCCARPRVPSHTNNGVMHTRQHKEASFAFFSSRNDLGFGQSSEARSCLMKLTNDVGSELLGAPFVEYLNRIVLKIKGSHSGIWAVGGQSFSTVPLDTAKGVKNRIVGFEAPRLPSAAAHLVGMNVEGVNTASEMRQRRRARGCVGSVANWTAFYPTSRLSGATNLRH